MVLVIVMAVMGSIVMVSIDTTVGNQATQETITKMEKLAVAITKHKTDSVAGITRPTALAGLLTDTASATCTASTTNSRMRGWCGPYIQVDVSNDATDYATDGWGTAFSYTPATGVLRSFGPNKVDNAGLVDDIERTGL